MAISSSPEPSAAAARPAVHVAAATRSIARDLLPSAAAWTAARRARTAEPVRRTAGRLANRELRNRARGRRRAVDFRQRRANEPAVNRPFFLFAGILVRLALVGVDSASRGSVCLLRNRRRDDVVEPWRGL